MNTKFSTSSTLNQKKKSQRLVTRLEQISEKKNVGRKVLGLLEDKPIRKIKNNINIT